MGSHRISKELTSSRANKDGKEYIKHHLPGQINLGKRKDKGHIRDRTREKMEVDLDRVRQQDTR